MTEYTHKLNIIVPLTILTEANYFASIIDPDTGGDKTFGSLQFSPDGLEPATHTGATGQVKQVVVDWLSDIEQGILPEVFNQTEVNLEQLNNLMTLLTIGIDEPFQNTIERAGVQEIMLWKQEN